MNLTESVRKRLQDAGWTVECESPFELRHEDGSFATQQAAEIVAEVLCEELNPRQWPITEMAMMGT